ncbi:sugar ABC transporter permease [Actinopolymorpha sp. B11F2]|uniref:sugar ABC transporter permease n=1 Tax=Actinopolymorpha sp. B11F2 TaxID=3160862 RepID=UPI0032E3C985
MAIVSHRDLRLEVTSRPMSGPLVPGRPPVKVLDYVLAIPAAMVLVLLIVPMLVTVVQAFDADRFGFGNFAAVLGDTDALRALWHTALWIVTALALVVVSFGIAMLSRAVDRWWLAFMGVIVLPFGASAVASGAAFRLMFDPVPERGLASALVFELFDRTPVWLGPGLIWFVLVSSFCWTWLGFAVSLFRAGLRASPEGVIRRARVEGAGRLRQLSIRVQMLWPVGATITLTLVAAAVRLFDLVLVATPGPMQDDVDTVAVHWWRLTAKPLEDQGQPAALAVILFAMLGVVALVLSHAMGRPRNVSTSPPHWWRERGRESDVRTRGWSIVVGSGICVLWALPVISLVATALRDPIDAGSTGWWRRGTEGLSLRSLEISAPGLVDSLSTTLTVALGATVLVVGTGLFAARALALSTRPRLARVVVAALTLLAVAPVQMYAVPLREAFTALRLAGSDFSLIFVHAAAALPLAILILRAALIAAPDSPEVDALRGQTRAVTAATRLWANAGRAVVAVAVIEFVQVWNDFIIALLVSGPGSSPLTLVLWGEARQFGTSAGTVAASAAVSAVVPVVVLLATWRRWVVPGLTGGVLR